MRVTEPSPHPEDDDALVTFLLTQEGLLDAVLAEHVDRNGDCAACPGPQSGRRRFPCDVWLVARRAAGIRALRLRAARSNPT